ncbi:family S53 protease-like protein [Mycena amicta]|nr:family S53 protease-like protein [Mycena amicta]
MKGPALLVAAIVLAVAAGPPRDMAVQESRETPGAGFVDSGPAPGSHPLKLRVQLKNNNLAGLEEALYAASDPASALYGQYLTADDVADFVKPSNETFQNVTAWLQENHIDFSAISPAKDTLQIILPVSEANKLLNTNFSVFTHVESGQTSVRTLEYSIPATLLPHIDLVYPTTSFARLRVAPKLNTSEVNRRGNPIPDNCNQAITPTCLQDLYSIPTTPATHSTNQIAVAGFLNQYANNQDLEDFLEVLRPDMSPFTSFQSFSLDGGMNLQDPLKAGFEANLDIQYTIGLATGVPVQFISVGPQTSDGVEGFIEIINTLITEETGNPRPSVLTISYGFDEDELSPAMATAMCNAYLQLSALGTTILFSSGDGGVGGTVKGENCTLTSFIPTAPSDCPFVTSVGSTTQIVEVAASFSSGGFSNYFPIPSYQATAVAIYLSALGSTYSGRFNRMGRAFPDISTQGAAYVVTVNGDSGPVSGTSASAPTVASMIALLNDELISAGMPQLGFLNPLLYSPTGRAAIHDITSGSNPGCSTAGFPALPGWDPVTGLGTPNYAALRAAVGL